MSFIQRLPPAPVVGPCPIGEAVDSVMVNLCRLMLTNPTTTASAKAQARSWLRDRGLFS